MEMLLMGICLSVLGFAVAAAAFGAATRPEAQARPAAAQPVRAASRPKFFAEHMVRPMTAGDRVPIEALLLQIENHVRLEHAAAESFVEMPNTALLHTKTMSPLVN